MDARDVVAKAKKKRMLGLHEDGDEVSLEKEAFVEQNLPVSKISDNSERPFYEDSVKVIEASDVILEVLDARDPLGTRCRDMEKMVMTSGVEKGLVLLLNKIDLVPREAAEKWLQYLREELPTIAFKCSTQEQKSNLESSSKGGKAADSILQTSDCLGAESLIKILNNYTRRHKIKKPITVGIIGFPNVGKSSLINSLKRSRVVDFGATPGLTRSLQEVQLDKNVKLLDCPGVVMLRSAGNDPSIAFRNCKRIEKLEDPISPVKEILKLCPSEVLVKLYKMRSFDSGDDFLQKGATVSCRLKKGGRVDVNAAARIVLHDWNEGNIPHFTMPPTRNEAEVSKAKSVTELGKVFNVDEVYGSESSLIGSLKSVNDFYSVIALPSVSPMLEERDWPFPDHITARVLSFFGDTRLIHRAAGTCSSFRRSAKDPTCYQHIYVMARQQYLTDSLFSDMIGRANDIHSIHIEGVEEEYEDYAVVEDVDFTTRFLRDLEGKSDSMERLVLCNLNEIVPEHLIEVLPHLTKLKHLELVNCAWPMAAVLKEVTTSLRLLETLILSGSNKDQDYVSAKRAHKLMKNSPNLKMLTLKGAGFAVDAYPTLLVGFAQKDLDLDLDYKEPDEERDEETDTETDEETDAETDTETDE